MKQSMAIVISALCIKAKQPAWDNESERIIDIQQRMQYITPSLISTTAFRGDTYVIQELQPVKDSINFKLIRDQYRDIYQVIDDMAMLTASAQLRSGGMQGSAIIDELSAFGNDNTWQEPLLAYAQKYSAKVKRYYKQFLGDYNGKKFQ